MIYSIYFILVRKWIETVIVGKCVPKCKHLQHTLTILSKVVTYYCTYFVLCFWYVFVIQFGLYRHTKPFHFISFCCLHLHQDSQKTYCISMEPSWLNKGWIKMSMFCIQSKIFKTNFNILENRLMQTEPGEQLFTASYAKLSKKLICSKLWSVRSMLIMFIIHVQYVLSDLLPAVWLAEDLRVAISSKQFSADSMFFLFFRAVRFSASSV